jgi:hypothetical protein
VAFNLTSRASPNLRAGDVEPYSLAQLFASLWRSVLEGLKETAGSEEAEDTQRKVNKKKQIGERTLCMRAADPSRNSTSARMSLSSSQERPESPERAAAGPWD